VWNLANTLALAEQKRFGGALIVSLTDNTHATMNLLGFANRSDIPIKWVKILLEQWSNQLDAEPRNRKSLPYYLEYYLILVERYMNELENYAKLGEIVQMVVEIISEDSNAFQSVAKLKSNETLWTFWQDLLKRFCAEPAV
jgi:hypothetical protein